MEEEEYERIFIQSFCDDRDGYILNRYESDTFENYVKNGFTIRKDFYNPLFVSENDLLLDICSFFQKDGSSINVFVNEKEVLFEFYCPNEYLQLKCIDMFIKIAKNLIDLEYKVYKFFKSEEST